MARPKVPLIDRNQVIARATEIIDRDGLESFSIRRLAADLGVNGASLYHHFRDKQAILDGVRLRVLRESSVAIPPRAEDRWQDSLRAVTVAYHELLLRHPNVAPLMDPNVLARPFSLTLRDQVATKLSEAAVPIALVYPIIDSVELLAYSSALLNPDCRPPIKRLAIEPDDGALALATAVEGAPDSAEALFMLQLEALIQGWTALVAASGGP